MHPYLDDQLLGVQECKLNVLMQGFGNAQSNDWDRQTVTATNGSWRRC